MRWCEREKSERLRDSTGCTGDEASPWPRSRGPLFVFFESIFTFFEDVPSFFGETWHFAAWLAVLANFKNLQKC